MSVKIIADSNCDLPKELVKEYSIHILPMIVYVGNKELREGEIEDTSEMYEYMKSGGSVKTAQIPYSDFDQCFSKLKNEGDQYIYIAFSSALSGTIQTAKIVQNEMQEENPDLDLEVIDSLSASLGYGLTVLEAAKMAKEGKSKEEIIDTINFYVDHMEALFTVDTLEFLHKGGRVSRTKAVVADVLNIKPVLDVQQGKLIPIESMRGRKKTINRLIEMVGERGDRLEEQAVGITYAVDLDTALKLKEKLAEQYGIKDFVMRELGTVIGCHSGPGTLAVFFLNKLDK